MWPFASAAEEDGGASWGGSEEVQAGGSGGRGLFGEETDDNGKVTDPGMVLLYAGISLGLTLMGGLMSGLTMGLMSLDLMNLQILKAGGSATERKYARKIIPIVKKHHLLLVTLLLANAACLEALPIFLDRITSPAVAIILSVTAVLFMGEIVPQAICTRWGLAIGANMAWFVKGLMALLFIITYPISLMLDKVLGEDHQPFYRRAELKELITMHTTLAMEGGAGDAEDGDGHMPASGLTHDESTIIKGALDMKAKTVRDCMTPMHAVFMLDKEDVMDRATMIRILRSGHSRVPVFDGTRQNVRGQMLVKTLILLDPKEATAVADIPLRSVPKVPSSLPLYDMLNEFQTGASHLVTVHDANDVNVLVGIITIEDVIEELIQEEIVDETDVFVDVEKRIRVARIFQSLNPSSDGADKPTLGADLSTRPSSSSGSGRAASGVASAPLVSLNDDPPHMNDTTPENKSLLD